MQRRLSFLDYMAGGCEIQCMIAIDFSGSNAPTTDPASCHYAGKPRTLNPSGNPEFMIPNPDYSARVPSTSARATRPPPTPPLPLCRQNILNPKS